MDGSSSGGGNGHRVEAERWLSISEKLLSAPTIAVHSSKYGQQECFGIFLQLRDQCICHVSRSPSFGILRTALEELFALCFSPAGSSKPLWDVILYMVSDVPLPTPGKDLVLFAIENCLLSVEAPPKYGLPHVEHVYIPLLFFIGVDHIDAPTPYMMGLHSSVDTPCNVWSGIWQCFLYQLICVRDSSTE